MQSIPTGSRPLVTIVIPAWNEERDLPGCLDAIAAQDYGTASVEVVVADGGSTDGTVTSARGEAEERNLSLAVVTNPARRTSAGLNRALAVAGGEIVVRVDARSRIQPTYVSTCVSVLQERPEVGVVGGAQLATARTPGNVDRAIARALQNRWATGLSRYRRTSVSGAADTVWMGAFRADELRQIGGWSEKVALNEDFELSQRYRRTGKIVWFDARLRSGYLPRQSFHALGRQYFRFGRVKGTWWARGEPVTARHAVLLATPVGGAALLTTVARRRGRRVAIFAFAGGAVLLDGLGTRHRAPLQVRVLAAAAILVLCACWWLGVVAGFVGERVGLSHADG